MPCPDVPCPDVPHLVLCVCHVYHTVSYDTIGVPDVGGPASTVPQRVRHRHPHQDRARRTQPHPRTGIVQQYLTIAVNVLFVNTAVRIMCSTGAIICSTVHITSCRFDGAHLYVHASNTQFRSLSGSSLIGIEGMAVCLLAQNTKMIRTKRKLRTFYERTKYR